MKRTLFWMSAIIIVLVALMLSSARAGDALPSIGSPAPVFTLEDQTGKKVSLSDFSGKVMVLEWINPDCPFVQRHYRAKTMAKLAEKYKDKGVVWLAVNTTYYMNKESNTKWISENHLSYPILDDHIGQVEIGRASCRERV